MATEFKTGNIVRLKSGGPKMTVKLFVDTWSAAAEFVEVGCHVHWFDGDRLFGGVFPKECVEIVAEEVSPDADQ